METTWSTTNKNANITLSNANLTANVNDNLTLHYAGISDATISGSQKIYWEVTVTNVGIGGAGQGFGVGIANSSFTFGNGNFYLGIDTNSLSYL